MFHFKNPVKFRIKLIECLNSPCYSFSQDFMHKQVHYLLNFLNTCTLSTNMPFDFVFSLKKNGRKAGGVSCFRFQNDDNKVEIALRVQQFWSEIKLVIKNCNRTFDFRPNCTPLSAITIINTHTKEVA